MTIKVTYNVTDVYMTTSVSPVYINVSYDGGGGGGAAVWGGITGTLSDQTDLQSALDGKFDDPTGTTSQYLRGDGSLATFPTIPTGTISSVGLTMPSAFNVANSPLTANGTLAVTGAGDTTQYIAGDGSLVAFPISGQAGTLVREVRNNSGATITKGTVVYINGASGSRPTIAKALATGDSTSAQTFGLVQADISNNSNGYIVAFGDLDGLDTQAITEGSQLYLSSTVAGGYTTTKQYAPAHLVYIGVVTRSHPTQGRIEVRIQNGYELDELHDVDALNPNNNDGIFYNSTTSLWEHKQLASALGYTPANAATTITINGVTYDLSANRSWTVAAGISGSGTAGQVAFWSGSSAVSGSNNLFWDSGNNRLGVGTNAPLGPLHIDSNISSLTNGLTITKTGVSLSDANFQISSGTQNAGQFFPIFLVTSNWLSSGNTLGGQFSARITNNSTNDIGLVFEARTKAQAALTQGWIASFRSFATDYMRLSAAGNLVIQNGGTFTDNGTDKLQVAGSVRVTGTSSFGGNMTLTLNQNATTSFTITNTNNNSAAGAYFRATASNGFFEFGKYSASTVYKFINNSDSYIYNATAGDISILNDFATGNIKFGAGGSSTAQMTFTSAGNLCIGITSGSDFLNIGAGTTAKAQINLASSTAPTSPNNGDIWFDGTDIKMRIGGATKTFTLI